MMKLRSFPRHLLVASLLAAGALTLPPQGHAQVLSAEQATAAATQLMNENKYQEAAAAFEGVVKNYPTSTSASDAQFRLGYLYYLLGKFDQSLTFLKKILLPPATPELTELGYGLIPQVLAGKAAMEKDEAKRKAAFEAAIVEFDSFLKKYPNSTQFETITYGRAVACFQIAKYDDAAASLRDNLKRFPNSESILDSQYLLSLGLMTQGSLLAQETPDAVNPAADVKFNESERLLTEIVTKRNDIALLNDAQFQIGELFLNRALYAPKDAKLALFAKATEAYRAVLPKGPTVDAQQARINTFRERYNTARTALNIAEMRRIEGLIDHETTKLAAVKAKGDLTVSSQIKLGQIYFYQQAYDEARVMFRQNQSFAEDDEQKKTLLYFLTLSYAQQTAKIAKEGHPALIEKAVENYTLFSTAYKSDPLGDNLPYSIGVLFLEDDAAKAVTFFEEGLKNYPKGRLTDDTLVAQANAFVSLKRYDEAVKTFKAILAQKPKPELAASAEFGIANALKETEKIAEAIVQYKKVATTYPTLPQAEPSAFWVGQLGLQKGDIPAAITELTAFLKDFPKSDLLPTAKFSLGDAYSQKNDKETAMRIFKEVADEYPKSDPAPYTYFQRSNILTSDRKTDEVLALMKEFIERYPDHEKIFFAYDIIAQTLIGKAQLTEAIVVYSEMAEKHPKDPQSPSALGSVVSLWIQHAGAQGPYFAMNEEQRAEWNKALNSSIATAEKLIAAYPESTQVASGIQNLLAAQKLFVKAKLKMDEEITKYFQDLATKFADKPQTKSKILFTLASFTYEKDKTAALQQMTSAYDPKLVYASADIDLFGSALLEQGKTDESIKVYEKLAGDFANPDAEHPEKAPLDVQEAQSVAVYGLGKAMQKKGDIAGAAAKFDLLKKLYPWSPKIMEANFGIAEAAHQQKKDEEAIPLLIQIVRSPNGGIELRANAMLLLAKIQEEKGEMLQAIDQYLKIAMFYDSVAGAASEGLWRGSQLLEKQAAGLPETSKDPKALLKGTQIKKAIKYYKELVAKYANSAHVEEAKARIAALEPAKK